MAGSFYHSCAIEAIDVFWPFTQHFRRISCTYGCLPRRARETCTARHHTNGEITLHVQARSEFGGRILIAQCANAIVILCYGPIKPLDYDIHITRQILL
jgi:hypothetical protein